MKREYVKIEIHLISDLELQSTLLTASIGPNETVKSVGQEVGGTFDFDAAENTFNHKWESGTIE